MKHGALQEITTASQSDVGRVRAQNEDHCDEFFRSDGQRLLVVADGMGGHAGGTVASHLAVDTMGAVFLHSASDAATLMGEAFAAANHAVHDAADRDAGLRGMGCTTVALLFSHDGATWVAHVGDSRAYRVREGRIEALTHDHSVVAELVRRGHITEEEARVHARRNEILRSIGVEATAVPDIAPVEVCAGDRFVLCSDGLTSFVEDEEIAAVVSREHPQQAVATLVALANARGGSDNVTVQVAAIPGPREGLATGERPGPTASRTHAEPRVRTIALTTAFVSVMLAAAVAWLAWSH